MIVLHNYSVPSTSTGRSGYTFWQVSPHPHMSVHLSCSFCTYTNFADNQFCSCISVIRVEPVVLEIRCRTLVSGSHPLVPRSNQWWVELVDMVLLKISRPAPWNRLWMYEVRAFLRLAEAVDILSSRTSSDEISPILYSRHTYFSIWRCIQGGIAERKPKLANALSISSSACRNALKWHATPFSANDPVLSVPLKAYHPSSASARFRPSFM